MNGTAPEPDAPEPGHWWILYRSVIPVELGVGFIVQVFNAVIFSRRRIRTKAYTLYLRTLSLVYLTAIVFMIPSVVGSAGIIDVRSYTAMFYYAHLDNFFVNLFLFTGSLIFLALVFEPLLHIWFPFFMRRCPPGRRVMVTLVTSATLLSLILIPFLLRQEVRRSETDDGGLIVTPRNDTTLQIASSIVQLHLESILIFLIAGLTLVLIWRLDKFARSKADGSTRHRDRGSRKTTTLLIILTTLGFLLCHLPSAVFAVWDAIMSATGSPFVNTEAYRVLQSLVNVLLTLDFTMVFVTQCLFSPEYRRALATLISGKRHQGDKTMVSSVAFE